ncbi:hypothetical protein P3X46_032257 [Hevea brasiliensis]|uniref:Uncharacterized protein n=1 Tax=Hevea brasiliensis TaxID=3981 RepID=A0ABQ9KCS1_HEVBR|nr:uncharacterized protein LOC110646068 [Hevea brasiliensis]KAJ9135033.1 hypothetical protein P3X46_032257 [Hevea brasiliensis]
MRLLKRIAGFLGFVKDEGAHEVKDQQAEEDDDHRNNHHEHQPRFSSNYQETGPRKGFSVPVKVAVDRHQLGPVLVPSISGDGGVQGLRWHAKRLKIDEDGDVADEFLEEVLPETSSCVDDHHKPLPRFEVKYSAQPAKIKNQVISHDGKFQVCVEYQGRLQWV